MTIEQFIQNLIQVVKETKSNVSNDKETTSTYTPKMTESFLRTSQDSQNAEEIKSKFQDKINAIEKKVKEIMVRSLDSLQFLLG